MTTNNEPIPAMWEQIVDLHLELVELRDKLRELQARNAELQAQLEKVAP